MNHEIVLFSNGTRSLKQLSTGQVMHSAVGPDLEAETLYFNPSRSHLSQAGRRTVWDVGMGTGANVLSVLKGLQSSELNQIEFVSFENDLDGLSTALNEKLPTVLGYEEVLHTLLQKGEFTHPDLGYSWRLVSGDFTRALGRLQDLPKAHLVYFDFYSPKACPELWSFETFSAIKNHCAENVLFLTYSASTSIRHALLKAGFFVGQGPRTEMKAETTQASLSLSVLNAPLTSDWLSRKTFSAEFQGMGQFSDSLLQK